MTISQTSDFEQQSDGVTFAYSGFLSYSQAADDRLATAIQSSLQRLGKPWYRLRMLRVFRDQSSQSFLENVIDSVE
jgi:hypothetical protein